jgi:hypothetical protein
MIRVSLNVENGIASLWSTILNPYLVVLLASWIIGIIVFAQLWSIISIG